MKYRKITYVTIALLCLMSSFIFGIYIGKTKDIPFIKRKFKWSIGIYTGKNPFDLSPPNNIKNPVITAKNTIDVTGEFVADPFMVKEGVRWYMFFEIMNARNRQGDIGLATSKDGLDWNYEQVVLDEPFHLSYPYVFKWKNEYYMIPECSETNSIRLYKAVDFPVQWTFIKTLLDGRDYVDSSVAYFGDKWWLFTATTKNNILYLYYADELAGPWIEHPNSPIVRENANISRPGGRILTFGNRIFRYTQDDYPTYGNQIRAFEIIKLTTIDYKEVAVSNNPILKASGIGWNADGMHHIDPHQLGEDRWIACVDGHRTFLALERRGKRND